MNPIAIRLIVFACVFGGALLGMFLRGALPEDHLSADSKDTVRIGMSLIGTLTALVLGLLVASAKSYYDTQSSELIEMSAKVVLLDRVLAHYGAETKEDRDLLRNAIGRVLEGLWPKDSGNIRQCYLRPPGAKLSMIKFRNYHRRTTLSAPFKLRP
jgi:hypothetical protein